MAFQADGGNLHMGRGAVFARRIEAAGTAHGFLFLGQSTRFGIQMNAEFAEERSAVEASAPTVKKMATRVSPEILITLKEYKSDNLSLVFLGSRTANIQAATAITNEVFNDVKQGRYIKLAKVGPVTGVNVEPSPTGTAYVLGTDYSIEDGAVPMIYIIPGGGIADGTEIQVDYVPTAYASPGLEEINGAVQPLVECELLFRPDPASGPKLKVEVWRTSISSEGLVEMIQHETNEFPSFEIKGAVLSDAAVHPTCPYFKLTKLGIVT